MDNYALALADGLDPIVIIPLFVLDFLCIHPFRDGNGRVSRLLTGQLLYREGYDVGRYISLERRFLETSETYYEALERSSQRWHEDKHDVMPWVRYFWGVILSAYREFEERVGKIEAGSGSKSKRVREAVDRKVVPFRSADLKKEVPDVSRDTIRMVLREMKKEGKIKSKGHGRGVRWIPLK